MSVPGVAVVAIGRNEGERLRACLTSVVGTAEVVVYVDSGSTDDSVAMAQAKGVHVVVLPKDVVFTAALARNAGWRHREPCRRPRRPAARRPADTAASPRRRPGGRGRRPLHRREHPPPQRQQDGTCPPLRLLAFASRSAHAVGAVVGCGRASPAPFT